MYLLEEYSGKCYLWPKKNRDTGMFEEAFELYGQRFISVIKFDKGF